MNGLFLLGRTALSVPGATGVIIIPVEKHSGRSTRWGCCRRERSLKGLHVLQGPSWRGHPDRDGLADGALKAPLVLQLGVRALDSGFLIMLPEQCQSRLGASPSRYTPETWLSAPNVGATS